MEESKSLTKCKSIQAHDDYILKISLSSNNKYLSTCSADRRIKLFRLSENEKFELSEHMVLKGHFKWVWDCHFSCDSAYLISCSTDNTIKLWDVEKGELVQTLKGHEKGVICLALNDITDWSNISIFLEVTLINQNQWKSASHFLLVDQKLPNGPELIDSSQKNNDEFQNGDRYEFGGIGCDFKVELILLLWSGCLDLGELGGLARHFLCNYVSLAQIIHLQQVLGNLDIAVMLDHEMVEICAVFDLHRLAYSPCRM